MKKLSLLVISFLSMATLVAGGKSAGKGHMLKKSGVDTSGFRLDKTICEPQLSYYDSLGMFPAYKMYGQWDTSVIHPYHFDQAVFKDSTKLVLTGQCASSSYCMPRIGRTNSNFGPRHRHAHFGVDIDLETGDTVLAAFDGRVRIAKRNKSYGNVVIIRHENGLETIYAHLSKLLVEPNQCVKAGELLGLGGNTGHSFGSHLHFEVRYKGEPLNPNELISFVDQRLIADTVEITGKSFEFYNNCSNGKYAVRGKGSLGSKSAGGVRFYAVRKGDTLYSIARKNGTTPTQICKLNRLKSSTVLHVGTKIRL